MPAHLKRAKLNDKCTTFALKMYFKSLDWSWYLYYVLVGDIMKAFGLYLILSLLTGNPFLALILLLLIFFIVERRFIGILPDIFKPWRRKNRARLLQKELKLNPANADVCLELGESYFRQGKYSQAISYLKQAAGKLAGHPLFHFYLGASYYYLGRNGQGEEELKKAISENPRVSFGEPYLYLLMIYLQEKQPEEKVTPVFDQLIRYGSPKTFYRAGKLFLSNQDRERARLLFRETIDNYEICRGALRRYYRKWAILSKLALLSNK
ncbi:MAG: Tetratricopeptide repeat protein [Pelotomaculum sp. PtaB.Bin104]|nr:MAG: Tetratricopeptide repeat protein [Pelotomaculum sp. PtaB.Bin104]